MEHANYRPRQWHAWGLGCRRVVYGMQMQIAWREISAAAPKPRASRSDMLHDSLNANTIPTE